MSFNVFACVFLDGADLARLVFQLINTCLPTLLEGSLDDLLQKPDLDWSDPLLKLATDVARGMRYLHMRRFYDEERGEEQSTVIHRDLKPENILIDHQGHLTLVDFGLSKLLGHASSSGKTYTLCGTLDYMAPEVLQNRGHDEGADWWSFGNVLYEILTGLPPFYCQGDDLKTAERAIKRKIIWNDKYVTANARDLIDKLLQVDPCRRFGCLKGATEDIKRHYYFSDIDWADAAAGPSDR